MVKVIKPKAKGGRKGGAGTSFGPVSTINTAPVAIGNTIRGSKAIVKNSPDGARIVGRDFAFNLGSTAATVTNWELIGGMPLTPCVLPSSVLRNYAQMYAHFKVNKMVVHYITSSPTSQAGDILFYYERDRKSPAPDFSNTSFLPYVLSDSNTIIGPQWTNHSLIVNPIPEWKSTAFGLNEDITEDAIGTVFLFSKTNATNSPGYVLIDYDITFKELCVNPRAGVLPVARGQYNQFTFGRTAFAVTTGSTPVSGLVSQGVGLNGAANALPAGTLTGDIFKVVFSSSSSILQNTWTNITLANLLLVPQAVDVAVAVDDGFTCYLSMRDPTVGGGDTPTGTLYPTLENAITNTNSYLFGVTATVTWSMTVNMSLVFSLANAYQQSSY